LITTVVMFLLLSGSTVIYLCAEVSGRSYYYCAV